MSRSLKWKKFFPPESATDLLRHVEPDTISSAPSSHASSPRRMTLPPRSALVGLDTARRPSRHPLFDTDPEHESPPPQAPSTQPGTTPQEESLSSSSSHAVSERQMDHTQALFAHTRDVILVLTGGGVIQYQSPSTAQVFGYPPRSLVGRSCFDVVHSDDRPALLDSFAALLRCPNESLPCEFRFWHHDGRWRAVAGNLHNRSEHPAIGGIVLSIHDVTEYKEVESQLRSSEANNRALLEAIPDLMFCIDRKGRVTAFKESLSEWRPRPEDKTGERDQYTLHAPHELIELTQSHAVRVLETQQNVLFECRLVMEESSSYYDYEIRVVRGSHGEALAIVRDITEKNRLQSELLKANRMAELGTLVASMGHEINNPLTYVIGHLEEILERLREAQGPLSYPLARHLQELAREALEGTHRIRTIAQDLRTYTRTDEDISDHVNVHHALDQALQMAANQVLQRAQLRRDYRPVPPVRASLGRLEQVFLNLLVNAAQAMPERSTCPCLIQLRTRYDTASRSVVVEVRDNGEGIPADRLDQIFEPFYTTKPVGAGTGLGLFVCRNIIEGLHGTLTVQSSEGEGTTFTITLPASEDRLLTPHPQSIRAAESRPHQTQLTIQTLNARQRESSPQASRTPQPAQPLTAPPARPALSQGFPSPLLTYPPPSHAYIPAPSPASPDLPKAGAAILVIDDEPRVAQSLRRILRGHQVSIVNAGQEGLQECLQRSYDLVFCDLLMPDLTGQEVFQQVTQQRPQYRQRFVFMTGGAFTDSTRAFCDSTDRPVLEKPFDRKAIRALVQRLLERRST